MPKAEALFSYLWALCYLTVTDNFDGRTAKFSDQKAGIETKSKICYVDVGRVLIRHNFPVRGMQTLFPGERFSLG